MIRSGAHTLVIPPLEKSGRKNRTIASLWAPPCINYFGLSGSPHVVIVNIFMPALAVRTLIKPGIWDIYLKGFLSRINPLPTADN